MAEANLPNELIPRQACATGDNSLFTNDGFVDISESKNAKIQRLEAEYEEISALLNKTTSELQDYKLSFYESQKELKKCRELKKDLDYYWERNAQLENENRLLKDQINTTSQECRQLREDLKDAQSLYWLSPSDSSHCFELGNELENAHHELCLLKNTNAHLEAEKCSLQQDLLNATSIAMTQNSFASNYHLQMENGNQTIYIQEQTIIKLKQELQSLSSSYKTLLYEKLKMEKELSKCENRHTYHEKQENKRFKMIKPNIRECKRCKKLVGENNVEECKYHPEKPTLKRTWEKHQGSYQSNLNFTEPADLHLWPCCFKTGRIQPEGCIIFPSHDIT